MAMATAQAGSCSSDLTPSLGTSHVTSESYKEKKKKERKKKKKGNPQSSTSVNLFSFILLALQ